MDLVDKIYIKNTSKGKSTVTKVQFYKGEIILIIKGIETSVRSKYTIQVKKDLHILPDALYGKYLNHSCDPNAYIIDNIKLIALRNIEIDEEITFDYTTTEDEIAAAFDCLCGSKNCLKRISTNTK